MSWITGYDAWSFYVYRGVILHHEGDPVWWGRAMDVLGARRTVLMLSDDNIRGYGDIFMQNPDKPPMGKLVGLMSGMGLEEAVIGVDMDTYYYIAVAHAPTLSLPAIAHAFSG